MATEFPIKANTSSAEDGIERLISALRKAGKEAGMVEKEIEEMVAATSKANQTGRQNINGVNQGLNNLGSTVKNVAKGMAALIAVDQLKEFGRQVIAITAEFQKFEAVLTNTLGSRGQAQRALAEISDFARKTPFSVRELTDSFIKLANQGFKPTRDELRRLGDLASSTGKSFDQITEAIIDAQVGEFERLKAFGIRASKEGDKVKFTFKEVETQTQFTSSAIRDYILSLGDATGVSGSMNAISQTLGGQINNLGDSWDKLLGVLGDRQSGALSWAIEGFGDLLQLLTDWAESRAQEQLRETNEYLATQLDLIRASGQAVGQANALNAERIELNERIAELERIINEEESKKVTLRNGRVLSQANIKLLGESREELRLKKELVAAIDEELTALDAEAKKKKDAEAAAAKQKQLEEEAKRRERINKLLREYLSLERGEGPEFQSDTNTLGATNQQSVMGFLFGAELNRIGQGARDEINAADQSAFDAAQLRREIDLDNEISHQAAVRDARRQTLDYSLMAINEVFRSRAIGIQNELTMLQQAANAELNLAGNNKEAKQRIAVEFERKQRELLTKQVAAEQEAALFTTLINMGPGIAKTIGTLGMPAAIPFIAAVAALIGLQQANIRKAQRPRFAATGEFDIDGPGTETSDSIPYFLSRRESVVHARGTKKFGDIIKPIIENANTDWHDIRRIVDLNLPAPASGNIIVQNSFSSEHFGLLQEQNRLLRRMAEKPSNRIKIDEQGFNVWMEKEAGWRTLIKNRYSS